MKNILTKKVLYNPKTVASYIVLSYIVGTITVGILACNANQGVCMTGYTIGVLPTI